MIYENNTNEKLKIKYEEDIISGKKEITINNLKLNNPSKKEYIYRKKKYKIKGNYFSGASLIGEDTIEIVPKLKWWEAIFTALPVLAFIFNIIFCLLSYDLITTFFLGVMIGILIFAAALVIITIGMREIKKLWIKILFGIFANAFSYLIWYLIVNFVINYVLINSRY